MFRECTTAEADIGMRCYLCPAEGTGGHLKTLPEDFVVTEISDPPRAKENGDYTIATVVSRNWETNRLVRIMARSMGMSRERIGFAGTKDKRAVTTQLMSFKCPPEDLAKVDLKDVEIRDAYRGSRAIQIGDLVGNEFEITVKDCTMDPARIPETVSKDISVIKKVGGFPNYFGVQRFGVVRPVTHLVGERLVRGDIEGAVRTYICFTTPEEDETLQEVRRSLEGTTDWGDAAKVMPEPMSFEKTMAQVLAGGGFNEMLSLRIQRGLPINMPVEGDIVIPLDPKGAPQHENPVMTTAKNIDLVARQIRAGRAFVTGALFGSETMLAEGEMGEIERKVVEDNSLKAEDFVIPGLPKCSSKGGRRELMCPVKGIASEFRDDGYTLRFSLPKGNYATCLMREFMT